MEERYFFRYVAISAAVALLALLLAGAFIYLWIKYNPHAVSSMFDTWLLAEREMMRDSEEVPLFSFETIVVETVERANPAVVTISISKDIPVYQRFYERIPGPFGDIFGITVPRLRQFGTEELEVGGGTGFLVSSDGYIVTNRHVVEDTDAEYTVFLNDGSPYEAEIIERDAALDIAVIKIDGTDFPFLPFGDSEELQVGQSVIAIGNALAEFRNTVSLGIVSGLSRSIIASDFEGNPEPLEELIQTDAAINRGNSGGPLLNLSGEVIGINVAVASGAENIGFALSGNRAKNAIDQVKSKIGTAGFIQN